MALQLRLILVYLSFLYTHAVLFVNAQPLALPGCKSKCGSFSIPYPFGIGRGCYRDKGFEVICRRDYSGFSSLILGITGTGVNDLSLEQISIYGPTISSCYDSKSGEGQRKAKILDLSQTPFTFSYTRNKFAAAGCDIFSYISDPNSSKYITGCVSLCDSKFINKDVLNATCSGIGCCQTSIPKGLKAFNLSVYSINTPTRSWASGSNGCSFASLNDWGELFPRLINSSVNLAINSTVQYVTASLDWAIGSTSCKHIARNASNSACIADCMS